MLVSVEKETVRTGSMTQPSGGAEQQTKTSVPASTHARNNRAVEKEKEHFWSLKDQNGEWAAAIYDIDQGKGPTKNRRTVRVCVTQAQARKLFVLLG